MNFRPIASSDFAEVLALNEESVHYLSALCADRLAALYQMSAFHRVVEDDDRVIAFLLAFREGAAYDSINYRWFAEKYPRFLYIDRVVVSRRTQSTGAGTALYQQAFLHASSSGIPLIACEFDVDPPNPISERFHAKFGFAEVGRQSVADGKKVVSLQTSIIPIQNGI